MSKNDKKLISIVLIVMMILSYILPVVSNAATTGDNIEFKDEYVKSQVLSYCDKNGDGEVSKEEIKNLNYIYISDQITDLTGLENATNIKRIQYRYRKENNINLSIFKDFDIQYLGVDINDRAVTDIDFSLFNILTNVEEISINSNFTTGVERTIDIATISKMSKINYLYMYNVTLKNASEIGKLSKLEYVNLSYSKGIKDVSFMKNNAKLKYVYLCGTDTENVDGLKGKDIEILNLNASKVSMKDKADFIELKDYTAYMDENFRVNSKIQGMFEYGQWNLTSSNTNVAEMVTNNSGLSYIKAKNIGEAEITATCKEDSSIVKKCKVKVQSIEANQTVGADMGATIVGGDTVLKANGELWKLYSSDKKMLKIDTNVKKYVYEVMYTSDNNGGTKSIDYSLTQKTDGTVKYVFNGQEKALTDAKDIYNNGYLRTDGTYLKMKEDGSWEEVAKDVESLVGSYLVKADGTYTIANIKVCDFKIKAASASIVVDTEGNVYGVQSTYTNGQSVMEATKIGDKFKEFTYGQYDSGYIDTDGKIFNRFGKEVENVFENNYFDTSVNNKLYLNKSNEAYLNDKLILKNVVSINLKSSYNADKAILICTDGSLWCLTLGGEGTLEKFAEETGKTIHFTNQALTVKKMSIGSKMEDVLTGFDVNNLKIADILGSTGLKAGYKAKVFDNDDKEVGIEGNIFTGAVVKIYNEKGDVVGSYVALVYGDVTGKGTPSATDALAIVKNKSGKVKIEDELYLEAGRLTENSKKTGAIPDVNDALALVKKVLGK